MIQREKISAERVFQNIIQSYWRNLLSLVFLFVILAGPYWLASNFLSYYIKNISTNYRLNHPDFRWVHLGYTFLGIYVQMFVFGLGCSLFTSAIILRRPLGEVIPQDSLFRYYFPAYRRIASLFILGAIVDCIVTVGLLLFIVPGCIFWARFCASVPLMISEKTGFLRAMRRSEAITDGHKVRIILIAGIVFVLGGILMVIPAVLVSRGITNFYILYGTQVVIGAFVGPLIPLTVVCLYHELKRVEKNSRPATDADLILEAESYKDNLMKPM